MLSSTARTATVVIMLLSAGEAAAAAVQPWVRAWGTALMAPEEFDYYPGPLGSIDLSLFSDTSTH